MLIDLSDLVSVTDLSRDLSGYIGKASQEGRRVVILNRNVPTAALVSIADLERLAANESGDEASAPIGASGDPLPPVPPGYTRLGTKPGGVVDIPLLSTLIVSGHTGSGKSVALSAAIVNANPDPAAPPVKLIVVTDRAAVWMSHEVRPETPPVIVVADDGAASKFKKDFLARISDRLRLLRTSRCNTVTEYRAEHPNEMLPDLLVALVDINIDAVDRFIGELRKLVEPAAFHEIGLHFWVFTQEQRMHLYPNLNWLQREGRVCQVAVGEQSEEVSRRLFGSTIAAGKARIPGHGYCQISGGTDGPAPVAIEPPAGIDAWRLETTADTAWLTGAEIPTSLASPAVVLADGSRVQARTPGAAQAVRDYLAGTAIDAAYRQNGMTLPPVGTPAVNPVDPTRLACGDIAMFKDHYEPVLSATKGYLNGEVVSLSEVTSRPDFVGFIDPTGSD